MRCSVPFSAVRAVVPISEDTSLLPSNIAVASGTNRSSKRADALRILANHPDINAVAMLEEQRATVATTIDLLSAACEVMKARSIKLREQNEPLQMQEMLKRYFSARLACNKTSSPEIPAIIGRTIEGVAPLIGTIINEVKSDTPHYLRTAMTYAANYSIGRDPVSYINGHTDDARGEDTYNAREVEICNGSGTILFADNDFKITLEPEGPSTTRASLLSSAVTCFELPQGASVILRAGATQNPSIHAHGITNGVSAEQRLTFRHDLRI